MIDGEDLYEVFLLLMGILIVFAGLSLGGYYTLLCLFGIYAIAGAIQRTVKDLLRFRNRPMRKKP
jgi:hypothetical protein